MLLLMVEPDFNNSEYFGSSRVLFLFKQLEDALVDGLPIFKHLLRARSRKKAALLSRVPVALAVVVRVKKKAELGVIGLILVVKRR